MCVADAKIHLATVRQWAGRWAALFNLRSSEYANHMLMRLTGHNVHKRVN